MNRTTAKPGGGALASLSLAMRSKRTAFVVLQMFSSGLPLGLVWIAIPDWMRSIGLRPRGFIAPAWLLGPGAWRALNEQPFEYTATRRRIHVLGVDPPASLACPAQVLSHASAWQQIGSVRWNAWRAHARRDAAQTRLELHPGDDTPRLTDAWRRTLRQQAADRQIVTLGDLAREVRVGARTAD